MSPNMGNKGMEVSTGMLGAIVVIFAMFVFGAYYAGGLKGASVVQETGTVGTCTIGSAVIENHPEGLFCYDKGSQDVWINYTAWISTVNADKDMGNGYLTIRADEGCLAMITATAVSTNETVMTVRMASSNRNFMFADYEDWPTPPNYLAEDDSVTFEYHTRILNVSGDGTTAGPANGTEFLNLTLKVEIPIPGEDIVGCNPDVGDGVCNWDEQIGYRRQDSWCDPNANGTSLNNATANCWVDPNDVTNQRVCTYNSTCRYEFNGSSTCFN